MPTSPRFIGDAPIGWKSSAQERVGHLVVDHPQRQFASGRAGHTCPSCNLRTSVAAASGVVVSRASLNLASLSSSWSLDTHGPAIHERWLKRHKRFHLHFTPTSSSWLNQVERWFRDLTEKNLRRGVFASVPDLIDSIQEYLDASNDNPKPYTWTATAESILAKVQRARTKLEQVVSQN